jgi:coproporphyrinogen III oxidase-like Fe-S oxidoreductase
MLASAAIVTPVSSRRRLAHDTDRAYLQQRMARPQRHRLLHGFPLAAALRRRREDDPADVTFDPATGRRLLVGVLPHPFCNPAVTGCGFCTFPHQSYHADRARAVVDSVVQEIDGRLALQPGLRRRRVAALYFGGGTANLTPADAFRRLCRSLAAAFDLSEAEVTLEGVPAYFVKRTPLLMDILREEIRARHLRISMGVQTFDSDWLRRMGRSAFGTRATFAEAVELAHARGFTASADLLFNLPGQSLAEMARDVDEAVRLGLDHIGLYHLVLFRGLGTAWSRDPDMLAGLPTNATAADNWQALRQQLLDADFRQTTLTNFEHTRYRGDERRFVYEEHSFHADRFDMLGFGPGAISFAADRSLAGGLKVLNPEGTDAYLAALGARLSPWDRCHAYGAYDLRIFYLTRRLAALEIDRRRYARLFSSDVLADFAGAFSAAREERLLQVTPHTVRPTPRGMFYADAIAALLARRATTVLGSAGVRRDDRASEDRDGNDNGYGHM